MFFIFKNFVLYFSILSCTYAIPPGDVNSQEESPTDIYFKKRVKKEMAVFDEFVNEISNDVKKGEFMGSLKQVIRRAIQADEFLEEKGVLKAQKNDADKYRLLLGLTYRIDCLEETLAPTTNFQGIQRSKRWLKIFGLGTPATEKLKKKVEDAGMSTDAFAKCIERLCDERNTRAGHAKISLPRIVKEETIEGALAIMEITNDKPIVEVIRIIAAPVEDLDLTTTTIPESPNQKNLD